MQSVQERYLELQRRWSGLSLHWRWSIAVLLGVALTGGGFGWWQSGQESETSEWLFSGQLFLPRELARMESAFAAAQLNHYEIVEGRIRIPRDRRTEYVGAILREGALPSQLDVEPSSDSATSSRFFETHQQQKERQRLARERELAVSVRLMKGIEDATVYIDEAVTGTGLRKQERVTAIVIVSPSDNRPLPPHLIRSIQRLIAGAKVDLNADEVTVADRSTGLVYGGDGAEHPDWEVRAESAARRLDLERQWSERIGRVLRFIPGVEVTATVEIPDPHVPGPADSPSDETLGQPTDSPSNIVSVLIGVPTSYYQRVWEDRVAARDARHDPPTEARLQAIERETHDRVRQAATQLLPIEPGGEIASRVTVFSFPDVISPTLSTVNQRSRLSAGTVTLLSIALACGGFALYGILRDVRVMRQGVPPPAPTLKVVHDEQEPALTAVSRTASPSASRAVSKTPPPGTSSTAIIHEELTHIVRENPQAAAEMLRNWVDQAG